MEKGQYTTSVRIEDLYSMFRNESPKEQKNIHEIIKDVRQVIVDRELIGYIHRAKAVEGGVALIGDGGILKSRDFYYRLAIGNIKLAQSEVEYFSNRKVDSLDKSIRLAKQAILLDVYYQNTSNIIKDLKLIKEAKKLKDTPNSQES